VALVLGRKQEHESPRQDAIESAIEESRILDGFANDGRVREIASECLDERGCCINSKRAEPFGNQNLGNGKTGPAA
jgi:hypothetical protein